MYDFGPYRVKLAERRLERGEEVLSLQPKTFDLLVYFVRNPGRLLRKEELLEQVWQDSHVEEANLAVHVSLLRKALGGSPDSYIATIPKYGYRFTAEVRRVEPEAPREPRAKMESAPERSKPAWQPVMGWGLMVGLVGVGFLVANRKQRPEFWTSMPLTATSTLELSPALSPDGKRLVYSLRGSWHSPPNPESTGLRLRTLASDELQVVTRKSDYNAAWSPDGKEIAFIRYVPLPNMNEEALLVLRSISSGEERVLLKVNYRGPLPGPGVSYTSDGKWLLTSVGTGFFDGSSPRHLAAVSRTTGEVIQLLENPKGSLGDSNPVISPKGDRMAFCRCKATNSCDLYEVRMAGMKPEGEVRQVTQLGMPEVRAVYMPDGSLVYPYGALHARMLWRYGMDWLGRPFRQQISPGGEDITQPTVAMGSDGHQRLVYVRNRVDTNIWKMDLADPGKAKPLIASTQPDQTPAISPDGKWVAFSSTRSGMWEIWACDIKGEQCRQITRLGPAFSHHPTWSGDSKHIVFESRTDGEPQLYWVALAAGKPVQITTGLGSYTDPIWTSDGKWLYFTSTQSGRPEIYRVPGPTNGEVIKRYDQVTPFGGSHVQMAPDGKTMLFTGLDLFTYRMTIGAPESLQRISDLAGGATYFIFPPVAGNRTFAYGLLFNNMKAFLGRVDWESLKVDFYRPARFDKNISFALSPDEKQLLWAQTDSTDSDLMIVDRFRY